MYLLRFPWIVLFQVSLLIALPLLGIAQRTDQPAFQCVTKNLSPKAQRATDAQAKMAFQVKQASKTASQARRASGSANATITYIPIRPHIVRKSDGTGGYPLANLNNVMALTNKQYLQNGTGIQFYFAGTTPDYIDDDGLYNQYEQYGQSAFNGRDANNALNQYYLHNGPGPSAYYPFNSVISTRSFLPDATNDYDLGNRTVPHELGHNFNLLHTFDSSYGDELVTRGAGANCATAGDLVCDTPADPWGHFANTTDCIVGCPPSYTCTFRDSQNNTYTPSPTNIMSYYYHCIYDFTPGQVERMQAGLALRQSHTAYTLDAPATLMAPPSNVVASLGNNTILISWQDNASNEMGYFIERSTSPNTGFVPIGGVGTNVTSFSDGSFTPGIAYYYRIRASNTTTGSTSPTAMIVATDYCRPTYTDDGCYYGLTINSVLVNGTTLSQNTGCSPASSNYYSSFTAVSGIVTAGQSANFTITKGTQYSTIGIYIWVDLNNDHFFDIGERLFQQSSTSENTMIAGSLIIPAGTPAGTVAMRIITAAGSSAINDACGRYNYGETEDYRLVIRSGCTTLYTQKAGSWDDPTVWSCNRVPTSTDVVQVGHSVVIPANFTAQASQVVYVSNGLLTFGATARLKLSSTP